MAWYKSPFEKGCKYIVIKSYSELGSDFNEGDIVEEVDNSYDPKLGLFRFWMRKIDTDEINIFHIYEDVGDIFLIVKDYFILHRC